MHLNKRLDAYADLVSRYARNSISLEHAHMVNGGTDSGCYEVAKLELRARKITNRINKIIAVMMQDDAYRQQVQFQTYPTPKINPINQMISSQVEVDRIGAVALQEAEEIMAIAYPSGTQPPLAVADTATTQTTQSMPLMATAATTAATAADCLDGRRTNRPASPSFIMNVATENHPGVTANPLLIVNTGNDDNTNSFIIPTLATNRQNCKENRNTVAFDNNIPKADKRINARLVEIASQGPVETTATNCHDCPVLDRCQITNNGEHQYQSMYTNQNSSYTKNNSRYYNDTWESHTDRTCKNCGIKVHIAKYCTKQNFWCQWYQTTTHDTAACRSKPRSSTPIESPSAGSYHPTQSSNQRNTSGHPPVPTHTSHKHHQPHQEAMSGQSC